MRIYSSATWALLASTFSVVVAQGPAQDPSPNIGSNGTTFRGDMFQTGSSVFLYQNISNGTTFKWTQKGNSVDIVRVDLMNGDDESIFFWCSDNSYCNRTTGFDVQVERLEITLSSSVMETLHRFVNAVLFFRIDWQSRNGKRDGQTYSAYSQEWAIVDDENDAASMFSSYVTQMTAGGPAARTSGLAPTAFTSAITSTASLEATASTTSSSITPTETATEKTGSKSNRLSTGAIVGIAVGCVGGVILVSVVAGCFCFRRRRDAGEELGGSRGVQDMIAEKDARASILGKDQPDTPYSEYNSQHALNRGLDLAGRNESGVDLGIGQAISSGEGNASVRTESLHTVTGGNRNSAAYSSLGGAANSAHGTPVIGSGAFASGHSSPLTQTHTPSMSAHDRSSAMGSPVPRASSQLDRSLSPYRDNAGQHDYSQQHHHHVVDGADLVQQEHSNDSTARSPSSLYSNPLDELQPISPESARDNNSDGAAGAGGAASSQPSGHGRTNTPSGIAQQYAHLVEEGMTNDEIRRLEEEERALDEAIEQAGTGGRKR